MTEAKKVIILWKEFDFVLFFLTCSRRKKGKIRLYVLLRPTENPGNTELQEHEDELLLEESLKRDIVATVCKLHEMRENK